MSGKQDSGKFCLQASVFAGVCLFATYAFLYALQDKLLYQPGAPIRYTHENPKGYRSPEERQMNYSLVALQTEDREIIKGWFMGEVDPRIEKSRANMRADRRLLIFFHENAGNIGLRLDYFGTVYHQANCDVLSVAYRGYSDSSGSPSEDGLKKDAAAVMAFADEYLIKHYVDKGGVFAMGRSLGGAVATSVISSLPQDQLNAIDALVLENTFTSIPDMVDAMFSVLGYLKGMVLTNYWRTIDLVGNITLPILYVTGKHDEIVPTEQTQRLLDASLRSRRTQIWQNKDGHHNDTWFVNRDAYLQMLNSFMGKAHQEGNDMRQKVADMVAQHEEVQAYRSGKKAAPSGKGGNVQQLESEL